MPWCSWITVLLVWMLSSPTKLRSSFSSCWNSNILWYPITLNAPNCLHLTPKPSAITTSKKLLVIAWDKWEMWCYRSLSLIFPTWNCIRNYVRGGLTPGVVLRCKWAAVESTQCCIMQGTTDIGKLFLFLGRRPPTLCQCSSFDDESPGHILKCPDIGEVGVWRRQRNIGVFHHLHLPQYFTFYEPG